MSGSPLADKMLDVDFAIREFAIDIVGTKENHLMICDSSHLSDATLLSILNDVEIALKNREVKS